MKAAVGVQFDLLHEKSPAPPSRVDWARPGEAPSESFLSRKDELLMMAIPLLGAVAAASVPALKLFGLSLKVSKVTVFLTSLIFLDGLHVLFTFVFLFSSPELLKWSFGSQIFAPKTWRTKYRFWAKTAFIAILLGLLVWAMKLSVTTSTLRGMATMWLFFELLGPAQHTIAQMRGISLCYNSNLRSRFCFSSAELLKSKNCERRERTLFKLLLAGECLYWLPKIFIPEHFDVPYLRLVKVAGGILLVVSALALLVNAFYFPHRGKSKKVAFLSRILLFPLRIVSPVAGIAVRACHGTEYLCIFRQILRKSDVSKRKRARTYWVTAVLCGLYVVPFCFIFPARVRHGFGLHPSDVLLGMALVGTAVVRYTHYYLDSVIFKMGDPSTRATVAPLLTNSKES